MRPPYGGGIDVSFCLLIVPLLIFCSPDLLDATVSTDKRQINVKFRKVTIRVDVPYSLKVGLDGASMGSMDLTG